MTSSRRLTRKAPDAAGRGTVIVPVESSIDLHPFAPRDVVGVVEEYLLAARAAGHLEVRLIHGRGRGVQRSRVHSLLKRLDFVASVREATPDTGGWGATVVTLLPPEVP